MTNSTLTKDQGSFLKKRTYDKDFLSRFRVCEAGLNPVAILKMVKCMKPMNERVMRALAELLEYADYDGGGCEDEHYNECLANGEDVSQHIRQAMEILRDYLAGREVEARFSLGELYATAGALEALEEARQETKDWKREPAETPAELFTRHECGDWGDLSQADKKENELSVKEGFRILSAYKLKATGEKLWVITEADRSKTTILRPDEH